MMKLLVLYTHLLATCAALGVIISTDLRLLFRIASPDVQIDPPEKYVERLVAGALVVLYATGGALIWFGLQERADYLDNPKLLGKLAFVGVLTANAFVLHWLTFPLLSPPRPLWTWSVTDRMRVALPVALSNSLWMYCAFLGIARPWNHAVPLLDIVGVGLAVFASVFVGAMAVMSFAAWRRRSGARWQDTVHDFALAGA
jgi:hypothetical protein